MQVVYAREPFPESFTKAIFLAGPTPRSNDVASWRRDALTMLRDFGYDGVVFVPEDRSGEAHFDYDHQIEWEEEGLRLADCIVFWVPRQINGGMPAFTTNDEWGTWKDSGKVVFGAPPWADKVRYQLHHAKQLGVPVEDALYETLLAAIKMVGEGAERRGGERFVPLHIWQMPSFKEWYGALKAAGNRLDGASVEWAYFAPKSRFVVFWSLKVNVWVEVEKRHKSNEVVISRPSTSCVLMYQKADRLDDYLVVLVREFRSPVSNNAGFVWELPGGSSFKPKSPEVNAAEEVFEETGVRIAPERLRYHGSNQIGATVTAHHAHLFSVELTDEEIEEIDAKRGQVFGNVEDSEQTYVEAWPLDLLRRSELIDWSVKGMTLSVLTEVHPRRVSS